VRANKQSIVRANASIWRMARWFWNETKRPYIDHSHVFELAFQHDKNIFYDKMALLLKKIGNNEFTGPDNHEN
jgi:hypothetical protein